MEIEISAASYMPYKEPMFNIAVFQKMPKLSKTEHNKVTICWKNKALAY